MVVTIVNLKQFNAGVNSFVKNLDERQVPNFIIGLAIRIYSGVVRRNPVKTGRSRANWQINVGSITSEKVENFSNSNADGQQRILQGLLKLRQIGKKAIGSIIYIYNNVHYILGLEDGKSKQAPVGMVRVTFAEILAGIDSSIEFLETATRVTNESNFE